ncbi:hypothetical protein [Pedobacter cryoconitis]|uniref:hypothetical protein n=1 Tax=Pedobacter cryoconitis TaxID=188932 RepID=UPI00161D98E4|nr:hypothetical protein [Pedobacter cryoconitis]MBB5645071.1 uncharacterized protein YpuA (DUF1002 family) [Pedobacter cryoconitis]
MKRQLLTVLIASASILYSCENNGANENSSQNNNEPLNESSSGTSTIGNTGKSSAEGYEMLHVVFDGKPQAEAIKKLMSAVMAKYNIEENYENLNRCGSALLSMRNSSAVGVTEILKHMYQYGDAGQAFPAQVAISATILEQTK